MRRLTLHSLFVTFSPKFQKCFDDCKKRWHKCIISGGDYFEGNENDLDKYIKIFHFISKFTLVFAHCSI